MTDGDIIYRLSPAVGNDELNELFSASWPQHSWRDFQPILNHSLAYVCAYDGGHLIGFVNLAWDGGIHAFVLDTTVHPDRRRRGIGIQLVREAVVAGQARGVEWVHVDFEPHLRDFYHGCGFQPTEAGLIGTGGNEGD
jgi:GNAT superfamily N-acetyltransferase